MGREFIGIFEEWANDYDDSVIGNDPQYEAVFANYDIILNEVVKHTRGNVLEFGVGTGNLSQKLLNAGHTVIGIEPSKAMREITNEKIPNLTVLDGDFIQFPSLEIPIQTIASTYAFHHLRDEEKRLAVEQYKDFLPEDGKIVLADTVFPSKKVKDEIIDEALSKGFHDLVEDLNREYYPTLDVIEDIFAPFNLSYKQMNDFVWLIIANKK